MYIQYLYNKRIIRVQTIYKYSCYSKVRVHLILPRCYFMETISLSETVSCYLTCKVKIKFAHILPSPNRGGATFRPGVHLNLLLQKIILFIHAG